MSPSTATPTVPRLGGAAAALRGSVYAAAAKRLAQFTGEVIPLHVGDTWLPPVDGARMEDLDSAALPDLHRYAPPPGQPALLEAIADRVAARTGVATAPADVLVTAGATGGLSALFATLLEPDDEVLIAAPFWPLIRGIVRSLHGVPVEVPLLDDAVPDANAAVEALRRHRTPRTTTLYISTPHNPTGRVIPGDWLEAIVAWAQAEGLWIVSDEVYADYVYGDAAHVPCRPLAPERVFGTHSFSKAYGMTGYRCGYLVGPREAMRAVRKIATYTVYSTPTPAQEVARRALTSDAGAAWITRARDAYRDVGNATAQRLGVPAPQGSTFLFLDVRDHLDDRGLLGLLEDCADRGLMLAPGPSFGPYPHHVRVCFTSAPPDAVARGVELLAQRLGR
ncbi:MAG: pyridoxal phosphate-dependent aminotransferase [Acidobacteriota bacterium]